MINFDDYANENKTLELRSHNPKWPYFSGHPYRILIIGGSGSGEKKCIIEFNKKPARY